MKLVAKLQKQHERAQADLQVQQDKEKQLRLSIKSLNKKLISNRLARVYHKEKYIHGIEEASQTIEEVRKGYEKQIVELNKAQALNQLLGHKVADLQNTKETHELHMQEIQSKSDENMSAQYQNFLFYHYIDNLTIQMLKSEVGSYSEYCNLCNQWLTMSDLHDIVLSWTFYNTSVYITESTFIQILTSVYTMHTRTALWQFMFATEVIQRQLYTAIDTEERFFRLKTWLITSKPESVSTDLEAISTFCLNVTLYLVLKWINTAQQTEELTIENAAQTIPIDLNNVLTKLQDNDLSPITFGTESIEFWLTDDGYVSNAEFSTFVEDRYLHLQINQTSETDDSADLNVQEAMVSFENCTVLTSLLEPNQKFANNVALAITKEYSNLEMLFWSVLPQRMIK